MSEPSSARSLSEIDNIDQAVKKAFPAPSFRAHQKQAIIDIVSAFQNGYQFVVLDAPTGSGKCLAEDTLVTTEDGIKPIKEVGEGDVLTAYNEDGEFVKKTAVTQFDEGEKDTVRITTERGYSLEGTPNHKIKVINEQGRLEWVRLGDLEEGAHVPLHRDPVQTDTYPEVTAPEIDDRYSSRLPKNITIDEAMGRFLGWFVADGSLQVGESSSAASITCHKDREDHMYDIVNATFTQIDPTVADYDQKTAVDIVLNSVQVVKLLQRLCYNDGEKTVPQEIFQAPESVRAAFLRGLFSGDGTINQNNASLSTTCVKLAEQVQQLLLTLGIGAQRTEKNGTYQGEAHLSYRVTISGKELLRFRDQIGQFYTTSQHTLDDIICEERNPNIDVLPNVHSLLKTVREQYTATDPEEDLHDLSGILKTMASYYQPHAGPKKPSRAQLKKFLDYMDIDSEEVQWLRTLADLPVLFDTVADIEESTAHVYDLHIPDVHNYMANGFISHNSIINTTVARLADDAFYTTPQNRLIDQILDDEFIADDYEAIRGQRHYECTNPRCTLDEDHSAGACPSNNSRDQNHDYRPTRHGACCNYPALREEKGTNIHVCSYPKRLQTALHSPHLLTNFHYFIVCPHIEYRELTVIDEAHNLEKTGFDFCDIKLTEYTIPFYDEIKGELPTDPEPLRDYILSTLMPMATERLNERSWIRQQDSAAIERVERLIHKVKKVKDLGTEFVVQRATNTDGEKIGIVLKPLYVDDFFDQYVFPKAQRFLLSSATFVAPKQQLQDIGVDPDDVQVVSMPNKFPRENRPIYTEYAADMRSKCVTPESYAQLGQAITRIARHHDDEKGIVHCVSYQRQARIAKELKQNDLNDRVLTHDSETAENVLRRFKRSEKPFILLSVAMEEGVDLADDLSRFNIIPKLPNPAMGDERVKERAVENKEWQWYFRQTAINLVQAYGRTTRGSDDYSATYILDRNFEQFRSRNQYLLPDWFVAAVSQQARFNEGDEIAAQ